MNAVSYIFEGETFTDYYCAHHFYLVKGDAGITVSEAPAVAVCEECEMADAAFESDKRAEARNEMFMLGIS